MECTRPCLLHAAERSLTLAQLTSSERVCGVVGKHLLDLLADRDRHRREIAELQANQLPGDLVMMWRVEYLGRVVASLDGLITSVKKDVRSCYKLLTLVRSMAQSYDNMACLRE